MSHGEPADGRAGVDDDLDLGLGDAVVDDLGGVEGVHAGGAGTLLACWCSASEHIWGFET